MPDTARIIAVCDGAVALINSVWTDKGAQDGVQRAWIPDINLTEDAEPVHTGKQLYVIPAPDAYSADLITRNDQQRNYKFRVLYVFRYVPENEEAPKTPPDSWVDEQVSFFQDTVFNPLANQTETVLLDEVVPSLEETATVQVIVDRDVLLQHKTFWAWAEFPYCEDTDTQGRVVL